MCADEGLAGSVILLLGPSFTFVLASRFVVRVLTGVCVGPRWMGGAVLFAGQWDGPSLLPTSPFLIVL